MYTATGFDVKTLISYLRETKNTLKILNFSKKWQKGAFKFNELSP